MPKKITKPSIIKAAGNKTKVIEEFIGRVNSNTNEVSMARMISPKGWTEPGQTPEFNEYTIVLSGVLSVKTMDDFLKLMPERHLLLLPENGCNIALQIRKVLNISPYTVRVSPRI
jgi:hypothetical protein